MEKIKKWVSKFWYVIVSVVGGILAIIFLGGKKPKDDNVVTTETISDIEDKKEEVVAEIHKLENDLEVIKDKKSDSIEEAKTDITNTLSEEKIDEEIINDFTNSW